MFEKIIKKIFNVTRYDDGDVFTVEILGLGIYANDRLLVTFEGKTFVTDSKQLFELPKQLAEEFPPKTDENGAKDVKVITIEYTRLPISEQFYFAWRRNKRA